LALFRVLRPAFPAGVGRCWCSEGGHINMTSCFRLTLAWFLSFGGFFLVVWLVWGFLFGFFLGGGLVGFCPAFCFDANTSILQMDVYSCCFHSMIFRRALLSGGRRCRWRPSTCRCYYVTIWKSSCLISNLEDPGSSPFACCPLLVGM